LDQHISANSENNRKRVVGPEQKIVRIDEENRRCHAFKKKKMRWVELKEFVWFQTYLNDTDRGTIMAFFLWSLLHYALKGDAKHSSFV